MDIALFCLSSAALAGCIAFLLCRNILRNRSALINSQESHIRDLEKNIHLRESEYIKEKNVQEVNFYSELKAARESAVKEGMEAGKTDREKDCQIQIANMKSEFSQQLEIEIKKSADEARAALRAEIESQTKLFSIKNIALRKNS